MRLYCDRCGKEYDEHTWRELNTMDCTQPLPAPPKPELTAENGLVNPEAAENTGEVLDLKIYQKALTDQLPQRLIDRADGDESAIWTPQS